MATTPHSPQYRRALKALKAKAAALYRADPEGTNVILPEQIGRPQPVVQPTIAVLNLTSADELAAKYAPELADLYAAARRELADSAPGVPAALVSEQG